MPPKKRTKRSSSQSPSPPPQRATSKSASSSSYASTGTTISTTTLPSAGLLLTCDPPTKQFIKRLDDLKTNDKKIVIEDLDSTHILVKEKAKDEILRKVEDWMNENIWTNVDAKGDLDT